MALTRFGAYYKKILEQIQEIREANDYKNDSVAFSHWYLKNYFDLDEQQIAESIIDGSDDLGIDAIIVDEEDCRLRVFQFKFPSKVETITKEITLDSVLKTWEGFIKLVSNDIEYKGINERYREYKKRLENLTITDFEIYFVSYNKGVVDNKENIESLAQKFAQDTGSHVEIKYQNVNDIANIYEKINRKNSIRITLKYKQMQSAYNVQERSIDSYVGFVNGVDVVKAISGYITTIFDENIRLYEYGASVNNGINRTATSSDESDMFYFFNNGVVFICDNASNSPASNQIVMDGASVVNGCQTLTVLYNAYNKEK